MRISKTSVLLFLAAAISTLIMLRSCEGNTAEARIADLDAHIRLLIEGKRQAGGSASRVQEFDAAIMAAVIERTTISRR